MKSRIHDNKIVMEAKAFLDGHGNVSMTALCFGVTEQMGTKPKDADSFRRRVQVAIANRLMQGEDFIMVAGKVMRRSLSHPASIVLIDSK